MNKKKAVQILFLVLLPIFILLLSYKAVLFFAPTTASQEQVFQFLSGKGLLQQGFTESEISHLEDVKKVMKYADIFFYILLFSLMAIITYFKKDSRFILRLFHQGGVSTIA